MNIINYSIIFIWILLIQFGKTEYTEKEYIEVAENYVYERYNNTVECDYRAVIDNMVYIYIDQVAYNGVPINYLDSLIILNKKTKNVIYANLKLNPDIYENLNKKKPLPLEEIPSFINELIYNGTYEINTNEINVSQKNNLKNIFEIDNIPFLVEEENNFIDIERIFEPVTKNNTGNIYELAYFITFTDIDYNDYFMILFAHTKKIKKITKNGYIMEL